MKRIAVIGLGYGDEGKGITVDWLCSKYPNSIVCRNDGGHQVGHTVKFGDIIHEFHHFGSGTLRGIPTYWYSRCTVSPVHFRLEWMELERKGIKPSIYIENTCPVTTPYDIAWNRASETQNRHGSVGVGYAATKKRNEFVSLIFMDLKYPWVLRTKLSMIKNYYLSLLEEKSVSFDLAYHFELKKLEGDSLTDDNFMDDCRFMDQNAISLSGEIECPSAVIHEGNQGILLDQYAGFYPHVTYGRTTLQNLVKEIYPTEILEIFYITRIYATKHGHGPLKNEGIPVNLINTEHEVNHDNEWQGNFRIAPLDLDMIRYAIEYNDDICFNIPIKTNIVVTCIDQVKNPQIMVNGELKPFSFDYLTPLVTGNIYYNDSPESKTFVRYDRKSTEVQAN